MMYPLHSNASCGTCLMDSSLEHSAYPGWQPQVGPALGSTLRTTNPHPTLKPCLSWSVFLPLTLIHLDIP